MKIHGDILYYSFISFNFSLIKGFLKSNIISWHFNLNESLVLFPRVLPSCHQRAVGNTSQNTQPRFLCGCGVPIVGSSNGLLFASLSLLKHAFLAWEVQSNRKSVTCTEVEEIVESDEHPFTFWLLRFMVAVGYDEVSTGYGQGFVNPRD